MSNEKNRVVVTFEQDLDYTTPERNGKPGKHVVFYNKVTFVSETLREIKALNIASWQVERLEHMIAINRLQGKKGFVLSKPITFEVTINNKKSETFGMKFSLSIPRIEAVLKRSPELIGRAFSGAAGNVADSTPQSALKNIAHMKTGNLLIAKAKKDDTKLLEFEPVVNEPVIAGLPLMEE